ncbi:MAG TPA: hypothetical protein VHC22_15485 [Pirellulales bacterium]|nr:hypothetical protein [Pirellulales bacterium]
MPESYSAETLAAAREYFRPPEPRFWIWGRDAISWTDGTTIVFHAELAEIMRRLAIDGLPRLTPLLLVLAACRESHRSERMRAALAAESLSIVADTTSPGATWETGLGVLDQIAALPADLRLTMPGKIVLIERIFAGRRPFPVKDALSAASLLTSLSPEELLADETSAAGHPNLVSELLILSTVGPLDVETLRLRLRTGMEQLVEPADDEPAHDASCRTFISRLRDDPELSGLGQLAHDLLAAVQVPRAISEPEDLPLGGVSDIANRGPLDRLLVSELAHDELTLAVRVAIGEALYLRREAPPRTPVRERSLLIDCGIRLWGVPRVFATAVGLAMAAAADRNTHVTAWRAAANEIELAELGTREGLVLHLEKLEPAPQPADALVRFFETIDQSADPVDAVLITHEDVLADHDFRQALAGLGDRSLFIATVDREGHFRLQLRSARGTKLIREAQFDLKRLLSRAQSPQPLIQPATGTDLPLILTTQPFPLLLPHQVDFKRVAFQKEHGAITLTHDRRLMHWRQRGRGAMELTASVPAGEIRHLSLDEHGVVRLLTGRAGVPWRLLRAKIATGAVQIVTIEARFGNSASVVLAQGVLYIIDDHQIRVVNDEGEVSRGLISRYRHAGGRFFTNPAWHALSFDGHAPKLTEIPIHSSIDRRSILAMFDVPERDGPWAVTRQGGVASTIDGRSLFPWTERTIESVRISPCGQRAVLLSSGSILRLTLGRQPSVEEFSARQSGDFYPELRMLVTPGSLPRRFWRIGINDDGHLALISRNDRALTFTKRTHDGRAVTHEGPARSVRLGQAFLLPENPPGLGYKLRVARWSDGSRAWLDSRGMLHLQSSDRTLGELTLVLVQNAELAAWSSDGRIWGTAFYIGRDEDPARSGNELLAEIDAIVARWK